MGNVQIEYLVQSFLTFIYQHLDLQNSCRNSTEFVRARHWTSSSANNLYDHSKITKFWFTRSVPKYFLVFHGLDAFDEYCLATW